MQTLASEYSESIANLTATPDVVSYAYTPYGEQIGDIVSGYTYNAEYYDAATGMLNLRARQYEPQMMRFAQKDILTGSILEPVSLNRYLYCQNNPLDFSDPSGMSILGKIASAAKNVAKTAVAATVKVAAKAVSTAAKVTSVAAKAVSAASKVVAKASSAVSNVAAKVAASSSSPTLKKLATSVSNSAAKVSKAATTVSKAANKVATVATKVADKADAITKMSTDQIVSGVKSVATSVAKTVATTVKSAVNTVVSCAKSFYENTVQPALDVAVSFYNQHSDLIHTGLDIIGSLPIPYVSTVANGINAGLYLCEGNYIEAASAALNMLPGGGVIGKIKNIGEKCVDIANVGMSLQSGSILGAAMGALSILPIGKILPKKASGIVDSGDELVDSMAKNGRKATDAAADAGDDIAGACGKLGGCFVAGTLVLTPDGLVPIEEIEVGDTVIATDPETGETTEKTVAEIYVRECDDLIHVYAGGEEIVTTPQHPFYVPEKGWTDAIHLRAGDMLQLVSGEYIVVEAVEHEVLETPVSVYNFQVTDFHTYYVGEQSVLVHNTCPVTGSGSVTYGELDSLGRATGIEATITQDMIGTGSPARSSIRPAGFGGQAQGHARGHLLGNQLGGSGSDPRNLVTIYQNPVNHPVMSSIEANVRKAVEGGQIVDYRVTPIYEGSNLIPCGITIQAQGSGGLNIFQTILNRK